MHDPLLTKEHSKHFIKLLIFMSTFGDVQYQDPPILVIIVDKLRTSHNNLYKQFFPASNICFCPSVLLTIGKHVAFFPCIEMLTSRL